MGHPAFRVGGSEASYIDQIGDHRRGSRFGPGALAVIQRGTDRVAPDQHCVHGALDVGDQALGRDQGRMDAQFDAVFLVLGDAQQLDPVAQLLGVLDVHGVEFGDALDIGLVELHRNAKGDGRHDGGLVGGIDAFNVKGRIGLGVAQALGLPQHVGEGQALVAHLGQDEIGGAVDDAGQPLDAVGREALAQGLDDRDTTGDGRLEGHHDALFLGGGENFVTMHGEQRLVGGDHMLTVFDGLEHQVAGHGVTADQLDHDVDVGVVDHGKGIVNDLDRAASQVAGMVKVAVGNLADTDGPAGAAADFFFVALQYRPDAAADGADA